MKNPCTPYTVYRRGSDLNKNINNIINTAVVKWSIYP